MFAALVTARAIVITENGKVTYPEGWGRTDGGHRANDRSAACLHD
jgi:hypothetical protein